MSEAEVSAPVHRLYAALRNSWLPINQFISLKPGKVWQLTKNSLPYF
ncbi:hypothetical protein [Commensalibacter sp. Nvir]